MKRTIALCATVICLIFLLNGLVSCSKKEDEEGWFVTDAAGFAIRFPEEWGVYSDPLNWVPVVEGESPLENEDDYFSEYVAVDVEQLSPEMNTEDYFDVYLNKLQGENEYFVQMELGDAEIGGQKWKYILYEKEMPEAHWLILAYITVHGNKGYVINCAAVKDQFERSRETMTAIAGTFRFE